MSKAVGKAVTRTKVKRRLRAQVAELLPLVPAGTDIVIRANPASAAADSAEIGAALRHCLSDVLVEEGA